MVSAIPAWLGLSFYRLDQIGALGFRGTGKVFFSLFFLLGIMPPGGGARIERLSWALWDARQAGVRQLLQVTGLSLAHVFEMVEISTASPKNLGSYQCSLRLDLKSSVKNLIYHLKPEWARCT